MPLPSGGTPDGSGILPGFSGTAGAGAAAAAVLACAVLLVLGPARRRLAGAVPAACTILFPHEVPG
jgi:hypothetical protein